MGEPRTQTSEGSWGALNENECTRGKRQKGRKTTRDLTDRLRTIPPSGFLAEGDLIQAGAREDSHKKITCDVQLRGRVMENTPA